MRAMRVPLALLVAVSGVAGAVSAPLLAGGSRSRVDEAAIIVVVTTYTVVALTIELARPGQPVGRLMLAGAAAWGVGEGLLAVGLAGLAHQPQSAAYAGVGVVGSSARGLGWLALVVMVPLIFPDGRAPSRWAARATVVCIVGFAVASLLSPQPLDERLGAAPNPLGLPQALRPVTEVAAISAIALALGCLVVAVVGLVRRWRRGSELVRQQVLLFGLAFAPPLLVLPVVPTSWAEPWMFALACLPVPLAVGTSLLQRRLYDIQLALSRTAAYVALSLVLAGVYAFVVAGIGVVLSDRGAPWLPWAAAGVVALAFSPLRDWLQGVANRITYGRWSTPAEVLADTGRRLADAADGTALLGSLADELVHGLGLQYAEIRDRHDRSLAHAGGEPARVERIALSAYGAPVGTLLWGGRALRESDRDLLHDLARQMGGVVHTAGVVEQLRDAQERLVAAREHERRRLRRDLHDGLGPSLAGIGLQVDVVQNLLAAGAPVGDRLDSLRAGLQETVKEVRRIVEGLRPPAVDELGLFGAVAELSHELVGATGMELTLQLPPERPLLPAAVEVAAYRVVQEALTNVVRHAGASTCRVGATLTPDTLVVCVEDDGRSRADARPGVGLASMQDRATEVGGRLHVRACETGTSVTLRLPLATAGATP